MREIIVREELRRYRSGHGVTDCIIRDEIGMSAWPKCVVFELLALNKMFLEKFQSLDQQILSTLPLHSFSQVNDVLEVHAFAGWGLLAALSGTNDGAPLLQERNADAQVIMDETQYLTLANSMADTIDSMSLARGGPVRNVLSGLSSKFRRMGPCFPKVATSLFGYRVPDTNSEGPPNNAVIRVEDSQLPSEIQQYDDAALSNNGLTFDNFEFFDETMWMPVLNTFAHTSQDNLGQRV